MSIFLISDIIDFTNQDNIFHFSLTKGYLLAEGFAKFMNTFYLTTGVTETKNNVNLININEIDKSFYKNIQIILLIREDNIIEIIKKVPYFEEIIFSKSHKIGIKSDTLNWMKNLNNQFQQYYSKNSSEFVNEYFHHVYVQTLEFKDLSKNIYKNGNKIKISRMGIPNNDPYQNQLDFFDYNKYDYMVDYFNTLTCGKALNPLILTEKGRNYVKTKFDMTKKRIKLVYMGRLKNDNGKILYMLRDIMNKLGDEYELHIFPGRFILPDCSITVFSPKFPCNLQVLRDSMFYSCTNVFVHYPISHEDKAKYLFNLDIGIDFSSVRPLNKKTPAGGAKLLEYCYYGLKVIAEKNINNSDLVTRGKNGILLENIASVDDYVNGIKELSKSIYDRQYVINTTIQTNNWDIIAKEIYEDFMCDIIS